MKVSGVWIKGQRPFSVTWFDDTECLSEYINKLKHSGKFAEIQRDNICFYSQPE